MARDGSSSLLVYLVEIVNAIPPLRRFVNRWLINKAAYATPTRPRPLSMAAPYPTWRGLTDRRFSGRHLPPAPAFTATLPDPALVLTAIRAHEGPASDRHQPALPVLRPMVHR